MTYPGVLRNDGFRRLLFGQAASAFGDWMGTIAMMALVLDITGSPTAVGGVLALRLLPSVFAGPLATTAAMRWDRRRTMLTMDVARAGLVVLIPLVDALWWVYGLAFVIEIGNLIFLPARDAAIPDLIDDDNELPSANGLILASSYGNIPLGAAAFAGLTALPAVLGGTLADHPYVLVFALDGLTYLVSFALIRTLDLRGSADEDLADDESTVRAFLGAFKMPLIRDVLPGLSTVIIGAGALFSLGIVYVQDVLGATRVEFGFLIAIFGLGAGVAVAWMQTREGRTTVDLIRAGVVGMGIVLAVMSLLSDLHLAFAVAVLFGAFASVALVGGISFLQEQLEGRQRTLGFTAFHIVLRFGMSLAALLAGAAVDLVPEMRFPVIGTVPPTGVVMFGAGMLVLAGGLTIRPGTVRRATGADDASAQARPQEEGT